MQKQKPLKDHVLPAGLPYLALLLGLTVTAVTTFYVRNDVAWEESRRFSEISSQTRNQIMLRMQRFGDVLIHTRALFAASNEVTRKDFHEYFVNSDLFSSSPGMRGIGYVVRVPAKDLQEHVKGVRRQGFPKYSIWPGYPREEYFTTLYYEPFQWNNLPTFGYDLSTDEVRRTAMNSARDSGEATLSGKVMLIRPSDQASVYPGFLLFVPLYQNKVTPPTVEERREKLQGFVFSPFRSQELFGSIFQGEAAPANQVQFEIYDGAPGEPDSLLYDSNDKPDFGITKAAWSSTTALSVHGHTWTLYVSSLPGFSTRTSRYAATFVGSTGLLLSFLAFWILLAIKRRVESERQRLIEETMARKQVEVLASELREAVRDRNFSLTSLETINKVGRVISAELDLERLMQEVNDAATAITRAKFGAFFANQVGPSGDTLTLYSISGVPREKFSHFPMPRATSVFAPTFAGTAVIRSNDITQDPRYGKNLPYHGMPEGHLPVKSYLAVPVISRSGEVLGGIFLGHPSPGIFSDRDEKAVVSLAAQAAVAVDNARLFKNAREAVAARDDFLSICSHELRTPLTSLKLQTQITRRLMAKDRSSVGPEKFQRFLDTTNVQIDRLVRLVEDMLDISRIRAGKLSLHAEPVNLKQLVSDVAERFSPQLGSSGSTITLHLSEEVHGTWDKFRMEQVLMNLLTNALKYGSGSTIDVYLSEDKGTAVLDVADQGIGIAKENHNRIFERFERAVSKQNISGLGLGLFIVRQIVESHGGTISVESEIGKGARFTVRLPMDFRLSPLTPPPGTTPCLRTDTVRTDTRYPPCTANPLILLAGFRAWRLHLPPQEPHGVVQTKPGVPPMKKLAVYFLFLYTAPLFAASSDTLLLQGTVTAVNDIAVTAVAGVNNSLNITAGQSNVTVANVSETSNNLAGYKIMMSSANAGELRNTSDAAKKTTYTVAYGSGSAVTPTTSAAQVKSVSSLTGLTTNSSAVKVNVTAYPSAPAGTYNDTLTFSIVAN